MADGPRWKRRKQANPRRTSVSSYSNALDNVSESDDDDKLHIAEEEGSLADGALPDEEQPRERCWDAATTAVKEDCVSDLDDDGSTDFLVEEMLQQGDTAVIFPEAPEDETHDGAAHDKNGTPDSFSQLLTCPYCARGYKRYSSLKEHIRYRHEKNPENLRCPDCSDCFAYRAQLDRHMTVHKIGRDQRLVTQSGGNRKFKCTECGKAFKYKHHLKEHLRIHSGEKPYECSNCKKRFSHSGSYSSHISSKKCIGVVSVNGRPRLSSGKPQSQGPSPPPPSVLRSQIREKLEHGKPFQEQPPIRQIKTEPVDDEYKPAVLAAVNSGVYGGGAAPPLQGTVQAVVLPTVGLVSPISINLADLQNALKVAVDGSVIRQVLENKASGLTTGTLHAAPQQLISAISLPIVGQDGNAKIIINYSLDPGQLKREPKPTPPGEITADPFRCQHPEDLTVQGGGPHPAQDNEDKTTKTCLLCENRPGGVGTLHTLKHCTKDKADPPVATLLTEGGLCTQPQNLLSLLKAYFALNAEPAKDELAKISDSVNLPLHVVKKWFDKMQEGQISLGAPTPPSEEEDGVVSPVPGRNSATKDQSVTWNSPTEATLAEVDSAHSLPLNLTAGGPIPARGLHGTEGPLDLSLPKLAGDEATGVAPKAHRHLAVLSGSNDEPLNLTCTKRAVSPPATGHGAVALYASQPSAKSLDMVATMQCLRALATNSNQTILIPQLAYTYSTVASSPAGTETAHLDGIKEERLEAGLDDQNDSDSGPARKKMRKTVGGMYACDLCDKIFQKSSSLLRHKYEHTGKRPHQCGICSKAFKHKHHLIEHLRLHSGEKPYQCDKCGKRFSHSGSYSQHMNHRYSYCKKEARGQPGGPGDDPEDDPEEALEDQEDQLDPVEELQNLLPSRGEEEEESEEEEEDEEEQEEGGGRGGGAVDLDDIQVVQIGDEGGDEEEEDEVMDTDRGVEEEQEEEKEEKTEEEEQREEGDADERRVKIPCWDTIRLAVSSRSRGGGARGHASSCPSQPGVPEGGAGRRRDHTLSK